MDARADDPLRAFIELALRQQRALARFEREQFDTATRHMEAILPALRAGGPGADPQAVRDALHIVSATLALLQALREAQSRVRQALAGLGATTGIAVDIEA